MDLIPQLNETALQHQAEEAIFETNCGLVAKRAKITTQELNESVVHWLIGIAQEVQKGTLTRPQADNTAAMADHADKMRGTAEILGGIVALTTPELADAMNIKNPQALLKIAKSDHRQSDIAIDKLKELGRSEARGQTAKATELLRGGKPEAIMTALKKLKYKAQRMLDPNSGGGQPNNARGQGTTGGGNSSQPAQQQQQGSLGLAGEMQKTPQI